MAVFYALVLGQCLVQEPQIFLHPSVGPDRTAALAMGVVFVGAAWEFLSYSLNIGRFPYAVRWITKSDTATEEIRFGLDLLVAATYGLLLIQAYGLYHHPAKSLNYFFGVLVVIDVLSLLSVLFGKVQWKIDNYRIFAEIPWIAAIWLLYALSHHDAQLNRAILELTIAFIFVRELLVRTKAKFVFESNHKRTQGEDSSANAKVYLAGPLGFFPYGVEYMKAMKDRLTARHFEPLDPWDLEDQSTEATFSDPDASPERLKEANSKAGELNTKKLNQADAVLAVLDGSDVDSGTAAEIGYAASRSIPVVGIRLDTRTSGDNAGAMVNLQVEYFIELSKGACVAAKSTNDHDVERAFDEALVALRVAIDSR